MSIPPLTSLQPFVPSGPDFAAACRFFEALGFVQDWENSGYAGYRCGSARFILQQVDGIGWADQFMIAIGVADLDAWWAAIDAPRLVERFPGVRINPPRDFPWGREVHFLDLAGVCWHVRAEA
jgi:hypothetical protein